MHQPHQHLRCPAAAATSPKPSAPMPLVLVLPCRPTGSCCCSNIASCRWARGGLLLTGGIGIGSSSGGGSSGGGGEGGGSAGTWQQWVARTHPAKCEFSHAQPIRHSLQDYNVTAPHPDAIPLERSILVPEVGAGTAMAALPCWRVSRFTAALHSCMLQSAALRLAACCAWQAHCRALPGVTLPLLVVQGPRYQIECPIRMPPAPIPHQIRNVSRRTCSICAPTPDMLREQHLADLGLTGDEPMPLVLPVWPGDGALVEGGGGGGSSDSESSSGRAASGSSRALDGQSGQGGCGGSGVGGSASITIVSSRGGQGGAAGGQGE